MNGDTVRPLGEQIGKSEMIKNKNNEIFRIGTAIVNASTKYHVSFYGTGISAGFPSPATDYMECNLDLNEYLIEHPAATYFVRVEGDSMKNAGIASGDILIVDRALPVGNNCIVVASIDNELTVKRLEKAENKVFLVPSNPEYPVIEVTGEMDLNIWGVVTFVIHEPK